jgi:hypothetical protein
MFIVLGIRISSVSKTYMYLFETNGMATLSTKVTDTI